MKVINFACVLLSGISVYADALAVPETASATLEAPTPTLSPSSTTTAVLDKRYKQVVKPNPDVNNGLKQKVTLVPDLLPGMEQAWLRTISSTIVEVVQPTVIAGVTFSAKPPATTNGLEPWISLNKDGSPKTIKPQQKNGHIKNGKPDYKNYFKDLKTVTYEQSQLKAHNLKDGDTFEEVVYLPEDQTYVSLNPLLRCTPDTYYKKGLAKDILSAPFCTPREGTSLKMGPTYFITWFTKYFSKDTQNVRIHLTYVKESAKEKGMNKRDLDFSNEGALPGTFYSSDWILNRDGYFPFEVQEEWLKGQYSRKVLINIQPDTIADEDFNLLNSNGTLITIMKGAVVAKTTKEQKALQDMGVSEDDDSVYYIILAMPTVVILASCFMYFFVYITRGHRDFSAVKKAYFKKRFGKRRNYDHLPQHKLDIALKRLD